MNRSRLMTTVFAAALAVAGAPAFGAEVKDATVLSVLNGKAAAAAHDAATPEAASAAPTDLDSAVRQAQNQRRSGDFPGAVRTLSQLVLAAPDDPRVLAEYGKTLVAQGRTEDALAFLERAIQLQPRDWSLYSAQGVALDQKRDYKAARAAYERALALKPGDATALSNAAMSRMQAGDLDGAETLLLQAAPAGADYPRIARNLALVQSLKAERRP